MRLLMMLMVTAMMAGCPRCEPSPVSMLARDVACKIAAGAVPAEWQGITPGAAEAVCRGVAGLLIRDVAPAPGVVTERLYCALVDPDELGGPNVVEVCFDTAAGASDAVAGSP